MKVSFFARRFHPAFFLHLFSIYPLRIDACYYTFFCFQLNQASTAFHSLSSAIVRFSFFHSISYLSCNRYVFVVVLLVAFPKQIGNLMISRYWVCFSLFCLPLQQHSSDRSISSSSSKRIKCESTKKYNCIQTLFKRVSNRVWAH